MKLNKVNVSSINPALISLIEDNFQILPVDANFFIPFDRSNIARNFQPLDFSTFEKLWMKPLFLTFPYIAIHESVYDEITVSTSSKNFIDNQLNTYKQPIILSDSDLSKEEHFVRVSIEKKISKYTRYEPEKDNADDRGEVKSLSYIATKGMLYFCSHDSNALKLIDKSLELETNLDDVSSVRTYEILYYLLKANAASKNIVRFLYKYLYYSTKNDKRENPEWSSFIESMDGLYAKRISSCLSFPNISVKP